MILKVKDSTCVTEQYSCQSGFCISERELKLFEEIDLFGSGGFDVYGYIDQVFGKSESWVVLHNCKFEYNKKPAVFDHLVINSYLEIFAINSSFFNCDIEVGETGRCLVNCNGKSFQVDSPIKLNEFNIFLLNSYLKHKNLLPKRLGMEMLPTFKNVILLSDKSEIDCKGNFCEGIIVTRVKDFKDVLKKHLTPIKADEKLRSVSHHMSTESIQKFSLDLLKSCE